MDKALSAVLGGVLVLGLIVMLPGIVRAMTPTAQYCCPICPECFFTYDELYQHFITEHPAEPIDIIWE